MRNRDNINQKDDGNFTIVSDDDQGKTTHKNEVRNRDNVKQNDGNVTIANSDRKQRKTHKSKFLAPKRKPTKLEERRMIGKAVEVLINSCMWAQLA